MFESFETIGLFEFLFVIIILMVLLKIISNVAPLLFKDDIVTQIKTKQPFVERLILLIGILGGISIAVYGENYVISAMYILSVAVCFKLLSNYISGIYLGLFGSFTKSQKVIIEGKTGVIISIDLLQTELELDNGEVLMVPNSKLLDTDIIKYYKDDLIYGYSFQLTIPQDKSINDVIDSINSYLPHLPWLLSGVKSIVELKESKDNCYILSVVVHTSAPEYGIKVEEELKNEFEQ